MKTKKQEEIQVTADNSYMLGIAKGRASVLADVEKILDEIKLKKVAISENKFIDAICKRLLIKEIKEVFKSLHSPQGQGNQVGSATVGLADNIAKDNPSEHSSVDSRKGCGEIFDYPSGKSYNCGRDQIIQLCPSCKSKGCGKEYKCEFTGYINICNEHFKCPSCKEKK